MQNVGDADLFDESILSSGGPLIERREQRGSAFRSLKVAISVLVELNGNLATCGICSRMEVGNVVFAENLRFPASEPPPLICMTVNFAAFRTLKYVAAPFI